MKDLLMMGGFAVVLTFIGAQAFVGGLAHGPDRGFVFDKADADQRAEWFQKMRRSEARSLKSAARKAFGDADFELSGGRMEPTTRRIDLTLSAADAPAEPIDEARAETAFLTSYCSRYVKTSMAKNDFAMRIFVKDITDELIRIRIDNTSCRGFS